MTLELFFVGGSFVIGVSQMAEAWLLLRQQGRPSAAVFVSSSVEFVWTLFCVYLLVTGGLEFSRWLAIMFLAYIPVGVIVGIRADPNLDTITPDSIRVPRSVALFGGVFGAVYATAALVFLAT